MSLGSEIRAQIAFNQARGAGAPPPCPEAPKLADRYIDIRLKYILEQQLPWILQNVRDNLISHPEKTGWEADLAPGVSVDGQGILRIQHDLLADALSYQIPEREEYKQIIEYCREQNIRFEYLKQGNVLTFDLSKPFYNADACKDLLRRTGGSWVEREDGRLRVDGDLNLRNIPEIIHVWPNLTHIFLGGRLICGQYQEDTLRILRNMPVMDNPAAVVRTRHEQPRPPGV